jgi:Fe-S cluster assembly ATPase SufC
MGEYSSIGSAYLTSDEYKEASDSLYKKNFHSDLKLFADHNGFIEGELHTFIGTKGSGKSTWSKTILSELVYSGKSPLLYISEERKNKYVQAINKTFRLMNKDESQVKKYLENIIVISEMDEKVKSVDQFFSLVTELVTSLELDIFIFDNFTTSFLSELGIQKQSEVLRKIKELADTLKIPILMFFHTAKLSDPKRLDGDNVRGSATAINIGSYNYLITQFMDGSELRNFVLTEKARYHSKANKSMYEVFYDQRVGLFTRCEDYYLADYNQLISGGKKMKRGFSE